MGVLYILMSIGLILAILGFPMFLIGLIMLIVKGIRRKSKKPAYIVMLKSVILIIGGFVLSAVDTDRLAEKEIEKAAKERAEQLIATEYNFDTITYDEVSVKNGRYTFSGSFIVNDISGNYKGFFEIVLRFNEYNDDGSVSFDHVIVDITPAVNLGIFR